MRIVCAVKFVPDVDSFSYDFENNSLLRENIRLILNPDDACSLALALKVKAGYPEAIIEVVTMGPESVLPHLEDLIRVNVDKGTLISDPVFAGSDTYATSLVLHRYLESKPFDILLTGTHALDGDTSHIPAQLAELFQLDYVSNVVGVDEEKTDRSKIVFVAEDEASFKTYEMTLPGVLGISRESGFKLPYPGYEELQRDVSNQIEVISNEVLGFERETVGLQGSLTRVVKTYSKDYELKKKTILKNDEEGIEHVFNFLINKGYL